MPRKSTDHNFVISMLQTQVTVLRKKHNTTSLNAFKILTKHKAFKDLMKMFYKDRKNKKYYLDRILNDNTTQNQFYKDNVIKDRRGITYLVRSKHKIHRKKR